MTKLLDEAVRAVRRLNQPDQDEIARAMMLLAGMDEPPLPPIPLTAGDRETIGRSMSEAERGEFVSDDEVRAMWAKHGL